jgi:hypothetical protein
VADDFQHVRGSGLLLTRFVEFPREQCNGSLTFAAAGVLPSFPRCRPPGPRRRYSFSLFSAYDHERRSYRSPSSTMEKRPSATASCTDTAARMTGRHRFGISLMQSAGLNDQCASQRYGHSSQSTYPLCVAAGTILYHAYRGRTKANRDQVVVGFTTRQRFASPLAEGRCSREAQRWLVSRSARGHWRPDTLHDLCYAGHSRAQRARCSFLRLRAHLKSHVQP